MKTNSAKEMATAIRQPMLAAALTAALASMSYAAPSQACETCDIFLAIDGIRGGSQDANFKDAINVLYYAAGFGNSGSIQAGVGAGAGKPYCSPLTIDKLLDIATPPLMQAAYTGRHFKSATLSVRRSGATPAVFYQVKLTEVAVQSLAQCGSCANDFKESAALIFGRAEISFTSTSSSGTPGETVTATIDCKTGGI
jgi:type VI secretion system secreted protein Hcp